MPKPRRIGETILDGGRFSLPARVLKRKSTWAWLVLLCAPVVGVCVGWLLTQV